MQILIFSSENIEQDKIPSQIRQNAQFDEFLFNKTPHLFLQINNTNNVNDTTFFSLFLEEDDNIYARFNVFFGEKNNPKTASSPLKMPFGSIEFSEKLSYEHLHFFVSEIQKFCQGKFKTTPSPSLKVGEQEVPHLFKEGLGVVKITSYPFSYAPEQAHTLTQVLLQQNFTIKNSEITHFIEVNKQKFSENISPAAQRRLKKCQKNPNFVFEKYILSDDLDEKRKQLNTCYAIFIENRQRKNYPISIDFESLFRLFCEFPDEHTIFVVKDLTENSSENSDENSNEISTKIISFSVAIRINKEILYHFIPADVAGYEAFSPMVFLINGMYEFCQKEEIKILDLGISTDNGTPNYGLIRFKKSLGAKSSLKLTFEKEF